MAIVKFKFDSLKCITNAKPIDVKIRDSEGNGYYAYLCQEGFAVNIQTDLYNIVVVFDEKPTPKELDLVIEINNFIYDDSFLYRRKK